MFGYNPTVQDRSGEISAQGTMNAANSISQGIGTAAQGISGAISAIGKYNQQVAQAKGTLGMANQLGLIDDTYKGMHPTQQIGAAENIAPLLNALSAQTQAQAMGTYRAQMLDLNQAKAANTADKGLTQL